MGNGTPEDPDKAKIINLIIKHVRPD
jgi:hypothetical protein